MTVKFTTVESSDREKDPHLSIDSKCWVERDEEKEERDEEYKQIAKFKLPERLELVDALPLTNVGKVNKKRLREMIAAKLEEKKPSR